MTRKQQQQRKKKQELNFRNCCGLKHHTAFFIFSFYTQRKKKPPYNNIWVEKPHHTKWWTKIWTHSARHTQHKLVYFNKFFFWFYYFLSIQQCCSQLHILLCHDICWIITKTRKRWTKKETHNFPYVFLYRIFFFFFCIILGIHQLINFLLTWYLLYCI